MNKVQTREGECAKCQSTDIDNNGSMELQDMNVYYSYNCKACGHSGKEWYTILYADSE